MTVLFSSHIFLFYTYEVSLFTSFYSGLKSILSQIRISTTSYLLLPLSCDTFFSSLYTNELSTINDKVCFLESAEI